MFLREKGRGGGEERLRIDRFFRSLILCIVPITLIESTHLFVRRITCKIICAVYVKDNVVATFELLNVYLCVC